MKVFVASSWLNKDKATAFMQRLRDEGHQIMHDWTASESTTDPILLQRDAIHNMDGVRAADVTVLLWPGRLGSAAEVGATLALGKHVILIEGEDHPVWNETWVYAFHPRVHIVETEEEATTILKMAHNMVEAFYGALSRTANSGLA